MDSASKIKSEYQKACLLSKLGSPRALRDNYGSQPHRQIRRAMTAQHYSDLSNFSLFAKVDIEGLLALITDKGSLNPVIFDGLDEKKMDMHCVHGISATASEIKTYLAAAVAAKDKIDETFGEDMTSSDSLEKSTGLSRPTINNSLRHLAQMGLITNSTKRAPSGYVFHRISLPKYDRKTSKTRLGYAYLPMAVVAAVCNSDSVALIRTLLMISLLTSRAVNTGVNGVHEPDGISFVFNDIFRSISLPSRTSKSEIVSRINAEFSGYFEIKTYDYDGFRYRRSKYNRVCVTYTEAGLQKFLPYRKGYDIRQWLSAEDIDRIRRALGLAGRIPRIDYPNADFERLFPQTFGKQSYLETIRRTHEKLDWTADETPDGYVSYEELPVKGLVTGLDDKLTDILVHSGIESFIFAVKSLSRECRADLTIVFSSGISTYVNEGGHAEKPGDEVVERAVEISQAIERIGTTLSAKAAQHTRHKIAYEMFILPETGKFFGIA